jgi:hypothetical protein
MGDDREFKWKNFTASAMPFSTLLAAPHLCIEMGGLEIWKIELRWWCII